MKAAVDYFEEGTSTTGVDGIKAIWVASDDPDIVDEVHTLAPVYFPNVTSEAIVYVANGVTGGPNTRGVDTVTRSQVYTTALRLSDHSHTVVSLRRQPFKCLVQGQGFMRRN